jgi:hypothetical protein
MREPYDFAVHGSSGNFLNLVHLMYQVGVPEVISQFQHCPANATYVSKTTVDELKGIIADSARGTFLEPLANAPFSIIADGCIDVSNVDEIAVIIRGVEKDTGVIFERFLCYVPLAEQRNAVAYKDAIVNALETHKLPIRNLSGQS